METQTLDKPGFKRLVNRMSKAFRDSAGGGIVERFENVSKLLFLKMFDERIDSEAKQGVDNFRGRMYLNAGGEDLEVYECAKDFWLEVMVAFNSRALQLDSHTSFPTDVSAVAKVIRMLEPFRLESVDIDIKGAAYEELLRDTFEKNDNQQFFTPRHLMNFVVSMASPEPGTRVCDPAVGSGGFLVEAIENVKGIYGTGNISIHGADIEERMTWIARINAFLHGADPSRIYHLAGAGSLGRTESLAGILPKESFDLILTNPPFGSDMTDAYALDGFITGRQLSRRRGVLFVERCIDLLVPGGKLAIIIDDSILNLKGNQDIRRLIRQQVIIEAVISLPDVTFMPYSTAKSSVLILSKKNNSQRSQPLVFMAEVENIGNRPNGDPLYCDEPGPLGARKLRSDLPEVLTAWQEFQKSGYVPALADGKPNIFSADIDMYSLEPDGDRLDVNFFHPSRMQAVKLLENMEVPTATLAELFDFMVSGVNISEVCQEGFVPWIGLGDIRQFTGEYEIKFQRAEDIKSAVHAFQSQDILLAKLRPNLRKVILIPDDSEPGVCSAELIVLRRKSNPKLPILPAYAAHILRSDLAYGQEVYRVTGIGRPRVSMEAIKQLRLPIPELSVQEEIVYDVNQALARYQMLQKEAQQLKTDSMNQLKDAYQKSISGVSTIDAGAVRG